MVFYCVCNGGGGCSLMGLMGWLVFIIKGIIKAIGIVIIALACSH
jgi:hypothetical protein